jgi:hypothetical protein
MTKPADAELKRYSFDHTRLRVIHVGNKESSIDGRTRLIDLGESVLEMIPILPDIFRKLLSVSEILTFLDACFCNFGTKPDVLAPACD